MKSSRSVSGYVVSSLSFSPAGISDYGAIAGTLNGAAVASLNGGPVTPLPLPTGFGPLSQVDAISSAGVTVGDSDGAGLLWQVTPACPPGNCGPPTVIAEPAGSQIAPFAVNNNSEVVGAVALLGSNAWHPFRWTPTRGFEDILPPGYAAGWANGVNDNGYIVGLANRTDQHVEAFRWSPSSPPAATSFGPDEATRIRLNGDAVGMSGDFTTTRLWALAGQTYALAGPSPSSIDGFAETGRVVGYTYGYAANPHQPWTVYQGSTTWLPWTPASTDDLVSHLSVNACGSIVGTQFRADGLEQGLMWTKSGCDPTGSTLPVLPFPSVSVSGSGDVTSLPAGISCGSTGSACSAEFAQNATVALTARPTGTPGKPNVWVFDHWEGA